MVAVFDSVWNYRVLLSQSTYTSMLTDVLECLNSILVTTSSLLSASRDWLYLGLLWLGSQWRSNTRFGTVQAFSVLVLDYSVLFFSVNYTFLLRLDWLTRVVCVYIHSISFYERVLSLCESAWISLIIIIIGQSLSNFWKKRLWLNIKHRYLGQASAWVLIDGLK